MGRPIASPDLQPPRMSLTLRTVKPEEATASTERPQVSPITPVDQEEDYDKWRGTEQGLHR